MDDLLEHSPAGGAQYLPQIIPILLQFAQHKVRPPAAAVRMPSPAAPLPLRLPCAVPPCADYCIRGAMLEAQAGAEKPGGGAPLALESLTAGGRRAPGRVAVLPCSRGAPGIQAARGAGGGRGAGQ